MIYKEYGVISGLNLANMIDAVDQAILKGWQPLGGVAITFGKFAPSGEPSEIGKQGILYAQAVAKL
ncbi:MAG: hypothetical protein JWQ40_2367 [Segetibacter sp.]|jgi:hypothetical protein|nr:hypothetical protein [Segetibacter sp.]